MFVTVRLASTEKEEVDFGSNVSATEKKEKIRMVDLSPKLRERILMTVL